MQENNFILGDIALRNSANYEYLLNIQVQRRFKEKNSVGLFGAKDEENLPAAEKLIEIKIRELDRVANTAYWI